MSRFGKAAKWLKEWQRKRKISKTPLGRLVRRRMGIIGQNLSQKVWGLGVLKKLVGKAGGTVLPYIVVRHPKGFSFERLGRVPARILVRSDVARSSGIGRAKWAGLPRSTFEVDSKNPQKTVIEVQEFMQQVVNSDKSIFFVVHPLRPQKDYVSSGQVNFDFKHGHEAWILSNSFHFSGTFRDAHSSSKVSSPLEKRLGAMVEQLKMFGIQGAEFSFATYKDNPNIPEYYDLRLNG